MKRRIFHLSALSLALSQIANVQASAWQPSQTDFGGVGLMQMPTARFANDGSFALGANVNEQYRQFHISLQLMPWLETTARYTIIPDLRYSNDTNFSGDNELTDKGFDIKLRLVKESYWLPELAIGLRDIGGTGLFDGEFIAASKRVGDFDFTLGVGWGYLGNSANLYGNKANNAHCDRDNSYAGKGGIVDSGRWFSGCAAIFGGVEYQTPWQPLSLKLEYDGNDYQSEVLTRNGIAVQQDSPLNYGLVYHLNNWGEISASFERGNTWTLGFALKTNFDTLKQPWSDNNMPTYQPATDDAAIDWQQAAEEINDIAGYKQTKIYQDENTVTLVGNQNKYRDQQQAQLRAATIIANTGTKAKTYQIIDSKSGLAVNQTTVDAEKFRAYSLQESTQANLNDALSHHNPTAKVTGSQQADLTNKWSFGLSPTLRQAFGGSEDFYLYSLGVSASASYWPVENFSLSGDLYVNLFDNYDKFLYETPPDGNELKRVRTLVRQYVSDNPAWINNLQATHFGRIGDNIYTQVYAGYLESMFAGVGSEILYRPYQSNWAFGMDINYAIQRDPNSAFGLYTQERHYDATIGRYYRVQTGTVTGHVSAYYQPEWSYFNNLLVKVSAGQYLTEDKGVTLDISKQFNSGVKVGAYAAFTNLSAEEYGEGSFNKGFYISIPLDVMTIKPSNNRAVISWAPLTRDGGQKLRTKYSLYDMTSTRYAGSELTNQ